MDLRNQPIGIFDSGIGGLVLARAIRQLLPKEKIIYFADTKYFPYGEKDKAIVGGYAQRIIDRLAEKGVKIVFIACNTASVLNEKGYLRKPASLPFLYDMIAPTIAYVHNHYAHCKKIGLIATPNTIHSEAYQKGLSSPRFSAEIHALPTPLLAAAVEKGNATELKNTLEYYLSQPALANIDALLLACTHYSLEKAAIQDYYARTKRQVILIDPAHIIGQGLKEKLLKESLTREGACEKDEVIISRAQPGFQAQVAKILCRDFTLSVEE